MLDVKGLDTLIGLRDKTAMELDYALATRAKTGKRPTFIFHNWKSRMIKASVVFCLRNLPANRENVDQHVLKTFPKNNGSKFCPE